MSIMSTCGLVELAIAPPVLCVALRQLCRCQVECVRCITTGDGSCVPPSGLAHRRVLHGRIAALAHKASGI